MDDILAALAAQHAELSGLVADRDDAEWARPSRCEGWSVADVVLHLAQTNEMAVASAEDRMEQFMIDVAGRVGARASIDDGAAAMVGAERGEPGAAVRDRWTRSTEALHAALTARDPHDRVTWVAGRLSVRTLTTTRLAETWIHTGDVADAFGVSLPATDRLREIARLAWRTLPYAFERAGRTLAGPVGFVLAGPGGEEWRFDPDGDPVTMVRGDALELCLVAARRVEPAATSLVAYGADGDAVLDLIRTYAQ
jgi:uncharacterized protein (TIGR03084 family)